MSLERQTRRRNGGRSIFRAVFAPLFCIMILQALIFYFAAVYGGIEESLRQNAADILSERLFNRKYEIETQFNAKWSELDGCSNALSALYKSYERRYGDRPLATESKLQKEFLSQSAGALIDTLRRNEVNGVFLILNDQPEQRAFAAEGVEYKYGLCIRDMDPDSNYTGTEDLLLERAPTSIVDALGCSLDSWWEPKYSFVSRADGDFYYEPLDAAWQNIGAAGDDLAYCSGVHRISDSDPTVVSYSIPLVAGDGYPYGVIGIEMATRRLASMLPSTELNKADKSCYIMTIQQAGSTDCEPIVGTGAMYSRCFDVGAPVSVANVADTGGFWVKGRTGVELYGDAATLDIYNNNNPFEDRQLTLLALVEGQTLFEYIGRVKVTLMVVALVSLVMGVLGITVVSRRFASPITALAGRVRGMRTQTDFRLSRLGITEIDQLVDAIEELNRNVSRNSARTEFFSRMSHDMRTPMNAIISFSSQELLQGATDEVKDDYLHKIHTSGEFLLALINEVLDMTKIESNKTELRLEKVQARRLCETVIPIIGALAQKKRIVFSWDVPIDPDVYVDVDAQHLNQIVMNLLSNAVKFTPDGGMVKLAASALDGGTPDRLLLRIVVSDSGVGMSEGFVKNLYTPFEQENARQEGTGLGLSIAKKLVELMDGTIECDSRQGYGTTFTLLIPLARCERPEGLDDTGAPAGRIRDVAELRGKRVLVCEDNAINMQIILKLLQNKGMITTTAVDGQAGVEAFAASGPDAFDAILMDIRMPVMDGLAATRAIRALPQADAATIPIIAMTANAFEEDVRASQEAGMNAHLAKPVEPGKLFETLLKYVK